jgi:hypothetical protein
MEKLLDLAPLSGKAKNALIAELWEKLQNPKNKLEKTSKNSSLPPSNWGKGLFAAVRSIVNTGRRQGMSTFQSILAVLNPLESLFPITI